MGTDERRQSAWTIARLPELDPHCTHTMDLILWRHAEAQEHPEGLAGHQGDVLDLKRRLTARGEKQAIRMARWLDRQLPQTVKVLCSPAERTQQTAMALGRKIRTVPCLAPGASVQDILGAAQWPEARSAVLVVGHQPSLGEAVAHLLGMAPGTCSVRKGSVWWLRHRERNEGADVVVRCVMAPDLL